jgi:hypothetical protein
MQQIRNGKGETGDLLRMQICLIYDSMSLKGIQKLSLNSEFHNQLILSRKTQRKYHPGIKMPNSHDKYIFTLKMAAVNSSETLVPTYQARVS